MSEIQANPEVVVAILQERGTTDPFIREIVRGAILEAALIEKEANDEEAETSGEEAEPDAP